MPLTPDQVLSERVAKLKASLIDPSLSDKRIIFQELAIAQQAANATALATSGGLSDVATGIDSSADINAILLLLSELLDEAINPNVVAQELNRNGGFNSLNTGFDLPLVGSTRRITATNRTSNLYYIQIHSSPGAVVTGSVPNAGEVYQVPAGATFALTAADLGSQGTAFGLEPHIVLSVTFDTYTPLSAIPANSISLFVESL